MCRVDSAGADDARWRMSNTPAPTPVTPSKATKMSIARREIRRGGFGFTTVSASFTWTRFATLPEIRGAVRRTDIARNADPKPQWTVRARSEGAVAAAPGRLFDKRCITTRSPNWVKDSPPPPCQVAAAEGLLVVGRLRCPSRASWCKSSGSSKLRGAAGGATRARRTCFACSPGPARGELPLPGRAW